MDKLIHKASGELETEDIYRRLGQRFERRGTDKIFEITQEALDRGVAAAINDPVTFGPKSKYVWLTVVSGPRKGHICYREKSTLTPIDD